LSLTTGINLPLSINASDLSFPLSLIFEKDKFKLHRMKVNYSYSIPDYKIFSCEFIFLLIFFTGLNTSLFSQTQKLSKQELRILQIDSVFEHAEANGIDTKQWLRYEYSFADPEKKQLDDLSEKLLRDSFEVISLDLKKDGLYHMQIIRNEILSKEKMYDKDKKFRALIFRFLVDDYGGFSISPYQKNPLEVPDNKYVAFIHTLENEPLYNAGNYLIRNNSYNKAILTFQECINRHFKEDTSNFQLGNALIATNDLVEGIEHWEQARNLNSQYLEPFLKLGTIFFENSHFNRALSNFQKADALKPDDDEILYNISKCLLQLERYNQAYQYAERASKINPKNKFVQGVLDILNQSEIKKLRKKFPEN
jgi:tetratricopeptide (TPR) repeat protein